jgi:hypothetical protein
VVWSQLLQPCQPTSHGYIHQRWISKRQTALFRQASDINMRHASLYGCYQGRSYRFLRFDRKPELLCYCLSSRVGCYLIIEANSSRSISIKHTRTSSPSSGLVHVFRIKRGRVVGNSSPRRHETRGITDPSAQPSEPKTHVHRVPRERDRYPMPSVLEY